MLVAKSPVAFICKFSAGKGRHCGLFSLVVNCLQERKQGIMKMGQNPTEIMKKQKVMNISKLLDEYLVDRLVHKYQ